jgi:hypothetical protein
MHSRKGGAARTSRAALPLLVDTKHFERRVLGATARIWSSLGSGPVPSRKMPTLPSC